MAPEEETVRNPIPLIMRAAVVLYKLGSCAEYRVVANQFGVHKNTVKKSVYIFCKGMMNRQIRNLIRMPGEVTGVAPLLQKWWGKISYYTIWAIGINFKLNIMCQNKCSDNINKANILEMYLLSSKESQCQCLCNTRFNSTYKQSSYGHDKPGKGMEF